MAVFDYGEAARLLEKALGVQEVLDPDDMARRCDLQLALAWARQREGDQNAARELALETAAVARRAALMEVLAGAAELIGSQTFLPFESDEPLEQLFRDLLDALPPGDSGERAYAMARLGLYLSATGTDYEQAAALSLAGLEMARRAGDPRYLWRVLWARLGALFGLPLEGSLPALLDARLALAEELERAAPAGLVEAENGPIRVRLGVALARGDMAEAGLQLNQMEAVAHRYRSSFFENTARGARMLFFFARGEIGRAIEFSDRGFTGLATMPGGESVGGFPRLRSRMLSAAGRGAEAEMITSDTLRATDVSARPCLDARPARGLCRRRTQLLEPS